MDLDEVVVVVDHPPEVVVVLLVDEEVVVVVLVDAMEDEGDVEEVDEEVVGVVGTSDTFVRRRRYHRLSICMPMGMSRCVCVCGCVSWIG